MSWSMIVQDLPSEELEDALMRVLSNDKFAEVPEEGKQQMSAAVTAALALVAGIDTSGDPLISVELSAAEPAGEARVVVKVDTHIPAAG